MGHHVIDFGAIEPHPMHECDRRSLQAAVDLEHLGMSIYTAEPGQQIPQQYHYHDTQEELLYVIEGEMHVETPEGELTVGANEVFVAEPNAPHRAFNHPDAAGPVRVVAVGGPMIKDGHNYSPEE